ncbi:hypothetical protein P7C73_g5795, partial [Tremellales sp. Uapishka_1]
MPTPSATSPENPSAVTGLLKKTSKEGLKTYHHSNSVEGLSSITSLIVGSEGCVVIDAPFLIPDGKAVVKWIQEITSVPVVAIFATHHHPDHYFSANALLEQWPKASFLAAPYVRAGIDREYDDKIIYWPTVFGDKVYTHPAKPEPYPYSFFIIPGEAQSPVVLIGPVQGDTVDHSMFYLPKEKTLITGDCMYGESIHLWAEEIETRSVLEAWRNIIDFIESLDLDKVIPGHSSAGTLLNTATNIEHNRKYLDLFAESISYNEKKLPADELKEKFSTAFPKCKENLDFFLGMLTSHYAKGGQAWPENAHHNIPGRTSEGLESFVLTNKARLEAKESENK